MRKLTYYDILAIPRDASSEQIRSAYRTKAMRIHPDRNKAPNAHHQFIQLRVAYEVLSNPARRSRYNDKLRDLEGEADREVSRHTFDDFANPGPAADAQPFQNTDDRGSVSQTMYFDPIEEAINIYAMSWRDFPSYPFSIKVKKIVLALSFRLLYATIGAVLGLIPLAIGFLFFLPAHNLPLVLSLNKVPLYLTATYFLLFGKPIVFHYARKWFGWGNDM